jgi:hypothetical protein
MDADDFNVAARGFSLEKEDFEKNNKNIVY